MNGGHNFNSPLPSPLKVDKLPPVPPEYGDAGDSVTSPPPPPKLLEVDLGSPLRTTHVLPDANGQALDLPPSPSDVPSQASPLSPTSSSAENRSKKSNPLNDLIDTEKAYVEQLTGIIRKVAAAWSRSNLPPPELDTMFRSIEGVYKANRSLLMKLKDIGKNPSSPKALGDLLMRWIDDLEVPYTTYSTKYCCGFDSWEPVQSNQKLASILEAFSSSNPPSTAELPLWTLDELFLLPKGRLRYYRRLYARLLKSTTPGRSDHRLLVGALDKLDKLLDTLDSRDNIKVGQPEPPTLSTGAAPALESEDVVVVQPRESLAPKHLSVEGGSGRSSNVASSDGGSARESGASHEQRSSRETTATSISRGSSTTISMPISDLERRLSTQRTLDIFTMKPKLVKLQMSPPALTYTREYRRSIDVTISVTPRSTGVEIIHRRGHIFLLSDLFLLCERMTHEEQLEFGSDGPDMWLLYPPLAGKVLRVNEASGQGSDFAVQVSIMRKENFFLHADSSDIQKALIKDFKDCIEFANSVGPVSKVPPPPVPPINGAFASSQSLSTNSSQSPPISRISSPALSQGSNGTTGQTPVHSFEPGQTMPLQPGQIFQPQPRGAGPSMPPSSYGEPSVHRSGSIQSNYDQQPVSVGVGQIMRNPSIASSIHGNRPLPNSAPASIGPGGIVPSSSFSDFRHPGPPGPGQYAPPPPRPPSEPTMDPNMLRKAPSTRSLNAQYADAPPPPPPPLVPQQMRFPQQQAMFNPGNMMPLRNIPPGPPGAHPGQFSGPARPMLPSNSYNSYVASTYDSFADPSPPNSPVQETPQLPSGPTTSSVSAQMKCKVFLKQQHAQWKSLGAARLKLYRQDPTNVKQLVVEADNKDHTVLISTIVLTDGVERVGKTGVAIELSDRGARTGIVYMIQLRNENSARGLFDSLLAGSGRRAL